MIVSANDSSALVYTFRKHNRPSKKTRGSRKQQYVVAGEPKPTYPQTRISSLHTLPETLTSIRNTQIFVNGHPVASRAKFSFSTKSPRRLLALPAPKSNAESFQFRFDKVYDSFSCLAKQPILPYKNQTKPNFLPRESDNSEQFKQHNIGAPKSSSMLPDNSLLLSPNLRASSEVHKRTPIYAKPIARQVAVTCDHNFFEMTPLPRATDSEKIEISNLLTADIFETPREIMRKASATTPSGLTDSQKKFANDLPVGEVMTPLLALSTVAAFEYSQAEKNVSADNPVVADISTATPALTDSGTPDSSPSLRPLPIFPSYLPLWEEKRKSNRIRPRVKLDVSDMCVAPQVCQGTLLTYASVLSDP